MDKIKASRSALVYEAHAMSDLYRFAAFISYSSKDAAFARRLHRALESYHIPTSLGRFDLIGSGKKNRIFPVFRDREELPSGELGEAIEAALKASNALIIVCSPHAAASPWVNKEIETFLAQGRHNRIFAIIADDAPLLDKAGADATIANFPLAFRGEGLANGAQGFEPLAADARKGKDGFRNAWLKIVAGLLGINAGALQDRDRKQRRAQRRALAGAAAAVALLCILGAAAFDALRWRTDVYQRADNAAREGRATEAAALAFAAMPAPFTLLPMRDDGADALARTLGAARVMADLGVITDFDLSDNGDLLVVRNAASRATAYEALHNNITELGPVQQVEISADGAGILVLPADRPGTVELFDTRTGTVSRHLNVDQAAYVRALSRDATKIFLTDLRSNEAEVLDLNTGMVTRLRSLGQVRDALMSMDGSRLLVQRGDQSHSIALFDLTANTRSELGSFPQSALALSPNGNRLWVQSSERNGTSYDLRTGERTALGELHHFAELTNGTHLLVQRADTNGTVVVFEMNSGERTEIGSFGPVQHAQLLDEGRQVFIWRVDAERTAVTVDLISGTSTELGPLGQSYNLPVFAADGSCVLLLRPTSPITARVLDLRDGGYVDLGAIGDAQGGEKLSGDGSALFIQREEGLSVIDLSRTVDVSGSGTVLASSICAVNANTLRPFLPNLRDPNRFAVGADNEPTDADRLTFAALRGRPWNPCDWRGIAAVLPNAETGDGWFEGPRQWLKLMAVRYFGAPDFRCEESIFGAMEASSGDQASAARRAARASMCAMYGPASILNISG